MLGHVSRSLLLLLSERQSNSLPEWGDGCLEASYQHVCALINILKLTLKIQIIVTYRMSSSLLSK